MFFVGSMLVVAGSMQGTMASLTSLVSLGSVMAVGSSERSRSLVRRVSLSKRTFRGNRRWHCVSFSVCKYSVTTTDFVAEHGNAVSPDANTYKGTKDADGGADFVLKPAPKPLLKSSGSRTEPFVDMNSMAWDPSRISGDSDDEKLGTEDERNKVIESLGEVLEKAEKLETSKSGAVGHKEDSNSEDKPATSNAGTNSRNPEPLNSTSSRKSKTLKSVWRKGDTVASVQKVVKESPKTINKIDKEPNSGGKIKVQSQRVTTLKPQPPSRPQPKLQGKPSIAPPPVKKPVVLKDVGAALKSSVANETDSSMRSKERKPILIDKFATKKPVVDPLIAEAVLAPTKPGKGPPPGKFKDEYRKKNVPAGHRRRMVTDDDVEIPDEETSELNVSIPGAATARKGRKWSKASRKAARLQAAKEAAPVKVEILEVGEKGMLIEELSHNLAISEGEILGYLYSKGIKPDGIQTLDRNIVKMVCKEFDVEVLDVDPIKVEEMARKKEILDEDDLDKLVGRPPVLTIMGHVDHGKVRHIIDKPFVFPMNDGVC